MKPRNYQREALEDGRDSWGRFAHDQKVHSIWGVALSLGSLGISVYGALSIHEGHTLYGIGEIASSSLLAGTLGRYTVNQFLSFRVSQHQSNLRQAQIDKLDNCLATTTPPTDNH